MSDRSKRTLAARRIEEQFVKVPIRRDSEPSRVCKICGAPGTKIVSTHKSTEHYCDEHLPVVFRPKA